MNYAFYISGKSGRLKKYLEQALREQISEIKLVISEYDIENELKKLLISNDISYRIYHYSELGENNKEKNLRLSDHMLEDFFNYNIDYCISFGSHILSGDLLKKYKNKIINFHPAILPMYPGIKSIDQAVQHGNTLLVGNTAHFIDSGVDTGPIIMQSVIPLKSFIETGDYDIVLDIQIEMLNKLVKILDKNLLNIVDGRVIIEGANYYRNHIYPEIEIE